MDLEFDDSLEEGNLDINFLGMGEAKTGFFSEEGSERNSPFILNPLFNDQPLLRRDQQYMFLELVRTILREYGHPEKEIALKLRDKEYLKRVFEYLSDQATLANTRSAIQAE